MGSHSVPVKKKLPADAGRFTCVSGPQKRNP